MSKTHYQDPPSDKEREQYKQFLAEDEELVVATGYGTTYLRSQVVYKIMWPGALVFIPVVGYAYWYGYNMGYGLLVALVLTIIFAIMMVIRMHHANRYLLTTRRVIVKKGIFAVKLTSALYDKITHLEMDQTFLDKLLLHHGTIFVHTAGSNKDELILNYVEYPLEFKNVLERLVNRQLQERGRHVTQLNEVEGELVD